MGKRRRYPDRSAETKEVASCQSESVGFQPAVAGGRIYVSTESGGLYSLETGDPNDDGWLMWGDNAAHNGIVQGEHRGQQ